jgi:hypothetical protein
MFNPAEEVVRCWHYENGFFTLQNQKVGLKEIDLLAINPHTQEKRHVEVKVATNPIGAVRLRGPMKFSKLPLAERVEEYAREKFEKVSTRVVELLNSNDYKKMLVLGRINQRYDDPQLVRKEFEKHQIQVIYFDDLVSELRKKLGQKRSSDTAGLFVQLLKMT